MRNRTRNSFSYGSMWMSDAPRFSASMSSTFESLMTGAASEDLASAPRSISSSSVLTVSTSPSSSAMESMSTSDRPTEAMSSKESDSPPIMSLRLGASPSFRPDAPMLWLDETPPPPSCLSWSERVEPSYLSIASSSDVSEATTGSTVYPVMNLMSSMAQPV